MNRFVGGLALAAMFVAFCRAIPAYERPQRRPVIVLAAFGTTDAAAVDSILNIVRRVEQAFPEYDVRLAFTSGIIRGIWRKRANDAAFRSENPQIPDEIYAIGNVLTTLARAQEDGGRPVLVQSLHVTDGEEYADLARLIDVLSAYRTAKPARRPFLWLGLGEPALGVGDGLEPYLARAADALQSLIDRARADGSALVLMAHGNEHLNQAVFGKLEMLLRERYPHVYIGTVEAAPTGGDVVAAFSNDANAPKKILLAPLMVVAGDHARNDMAGDGDDSWARMFREAGYEVSCHLEGLGSSDDWADIYVEHLKALEAKARAFLAEEKAK